MYAHANISESHVRESDEVPARGASHHPQHKVAVGLPQYPGLPARPRSRAPGRGANREEHPVLRAILFAGDGVQLRHAAGLRSVLMLFGVRPVRADQVQQVRLPGVRVQAVPDCAPPPPHP